MAADGISTRDEILPDLRRIRRFHVEGDRRGTRNGFYRLHTDGPPAGLYGSWKFGLKKTWRFQGPGIKPDAATRQRIAEEQKRRLEEEAREYEQASLKAENIWTRAEEAPNDHPYLLRKKVQPHGLRMSCARLLVPLRDVEGKLWSLEFIFPNGDKRYLYGARKQACFHLIGSLNGKLSIAEGYATGATVYEATGEAVGVAFDCGNLLPVARELRKKFPAVEMVIVGDDDHTHKGNPGLTHAQQAAKAVNAKLLVPRFSKQRDEDDTDFNDLARLEGLEEVRKQLAKPEHRDEAEADVPEFPRSILEGSYIGDLALALTAGTALAPQFAYDDIKTSLGSLLNRRVGFPGHEDIHLRHYNLKITHRPRQGKGETRKRVQSALGLLLEQHNIQIEDGTRFGSGQFMVKKLSEMEKTRQGPLDLLVSFDEMRDFFQKADIRSSTLISVFCTLFEKHSIKQGSFDHGDHAVEDTHLSFIGDFTAAMFQQCLAGRGAAGQGFLPRCALTYGRWKPAGDWTPRNIEREQGIVDKIRHVLERLPEGVFVPKEEEDARECRLDFFAGLEKQIEQGDYFPLEIQSYFKRDLLLRVVFSDDPVITLPQTARSIAWANNQLNVRRALWPEDIGSQTEQMERKLQRLARERGPMSNRDYQRFAHVHSPGCGGFEVYNRAMLNLRRAGVFVIVGQTRKKNPLWWFAPDDD
jgi:putative DNA primase/helicase